jgi:hypothetical protein
MASHAAFIKIEEGDPQNRQRTMITADGRQPLSNPGACCGVCSEHLQITWPTLDALEKSALNGTCLICVQIYEGLGNLGSRDELIQLGFAEVEISEASTEDESAWITPALGSSRGEKPRFQVRFSL